MNQSVGRGIIFQCDKSAKSARCFLSLLILLISSPLLHGAQWYVSTDSGDNSNPGTNWLTAKKTIQAAVNLAAPYDTVWVTNGVYREGSTILTGMTSSNRVAITNAVIVRSLNGAAFTSIEGSGPIGTSAVRCAYLTSGAVLAGFTLTNGHSSSGGIWPTDSCGGGAVAQGGVLSNCVITGNNAAMHGGGVMFGYLENCTITSNKASYGGGLASGTVYACVFDRNIASDSGGAVYYSSLTNATLINNMATSFGGGARGGTFRNCTLAFNTAPNGGGCYNGTLFDSQLLTNSANGGGGIFNGTLSNCLCNGNSAYSAGGGINVTAYSSTFAFNRATNNYGGLDSAVLTDCLIQSNVATQAAGLTRSTLRDCRIIGNVASDSDGGGSYCSLTNCLIAGNSANTFGGFENSTLYRCIVRDNSSTNSGGGVGGGSMTACAVFGNRAGNRGGGACGTSITNCTIVQNTAHNGGGVCYGSVYNSIVYFNAASMNQDISESAVGYTFSAPAQIGTENREADPRLVTAWRIAPDSPCRGAGSPVYTTGTDLDGEPWQAIPSAGCDEVCETNFTGPLAPLISPGNLRIASGYEATFTGDTQGRSGNTLWDLGDGTRLSNQFQVSHSWATAGVYAVIFNAANITSPGGIMTTVLVTVVDQPIYYVNRSNPAPVSPYLSWSAAATNLQDAVSLANTNVPGTLVLVTNGLYDTGYKMFPSGSTRSRFAATNAVIIRSVNGPHATTISGNTTPYRVRCAYLDHGAVLSGFTLTNGNTETTGDNTLAQSGGGCYIGNGVLTNCWIINSHANYAGGGAYGGKVIKCTFSNNEAAWRGGGIAESFAQDSAIHNNNGNGAYYSSLTNCQVTSNYGYDGGGLYYCSASACTLSNNAAAYGGGANRSTLWQCSLIRNQSYQEGGGLYYGSAAGCFFLSNSALYGGGACGYVPADAVIVNSVLQGNTAATNGGGASGATLLNSILSGNSAYRDGGGATASSLTNCLITDGWSGNTGGGLHNSTAFFCTISHNSSDIGGGTYLGKANQSILAFNTAYSDGMNFDSTLIDNSCTDPLPPSGTGNIIADPQFINPAANNWRLRHGSPCVDSAAATPGISDDLDGNTRPLDGNHDGTNAPDMGCYEYNPQTADSNADTIPDWWCLRYALDPNDDTVPAGNPDADEATTLQEWLTDTDPTNRASRLQITILTIDPLTEFCFESSSNRLYTLQWSSNLVNGVWNNTSIVRQRGLGGQEYMPFERELVTPLFYRILTEFP